MTPEDLPVPGELSPSDEEDFDAFLNSIQGFSYTGDPNVVGSNDEPPTDDEPDDDSQDDDTTDETGDEPTPPSGLRPDTPLTSTVRIGDNDVPLEEVTQLYELGKTLRENGLDAGVSPAPQAPQPPVDQTPEPTVVTPPAYIDPEDEVQMGLWTELQELKGTVNKQQQFVQQTAEQQARATAEAHLEQAISIYRTKYPSITEQDLNVIRPQAALIVNAMIAKHGPVDGMVRALYVTSLDMDAYRDKVLNTGTPPVKDSHKRKRNLNSVSPGSSGSAPRTNPRPQYTSDRDVVNAMARELADNISTNGRIN